MVDISVVAEKFDELTKTESVELAKEIRLMVREEFINEDGNLVLTKELLDKYKKVGLKVRIILPKKNDDMCDLVMYTEQGPGIVIDHFPRNEFMA